MNCRGISAKNILVESDGTLKLVNFRCKKVKDRTDTRPEEIQALGHMLLQLYFNVREFHLYFSPNEMLFSSQSNWKKLEDLSAAFNEKPPRELSKELKDLLTQMIQPEAKMTIEQVAYQFK